MLSVVWKYSGNILVIKLPYCARSSVSLVNFRLSSDPRSTVSDRASVEVLLVVFVLLVISLRQFHQRTQKSSWDLMAKVNSIKIKNNEIPPFQLFRSFGKPQSHLLLVRIKRLRLLTNACGTCDCVGYCFRVLLYMFQRKKLGKRERGSVSLKCIMKTEF